MTGHPSTITYICTLFVSNFFPTKCVFDVEPTVFLSSNRINVTNCHKSALNKNTFCFFSTKQLKNTFFIIKVYFESSEYIYYICTFVYTKYYINFKKTEQK
jgi:hypothetical protein